MTSSQASRVVRQAGDDDNSHILIAVMAARTSPQYRAAFVRAVGEFRDAYPEERLEEIIEENGANVDDGIDFEEFALLLAILARLQVRITRESGTATALGISESVGEAFSFQMDAEMVERMRDRIREDVGFIVRNTRRGATTMVELMLEDGLSPEQAAKKLSRRLGLDEKRARSIRNLERGLSDTNIVDDEETLRLVEQFEDAQLEDRAAEAASVGVWYGAQQGRQFGFELGVAAGVLTALAVKIWNTLRDELVCPRCGPLHLQEVLIGQFFVSPYDGSAVLSPGLHPRCRCFTTWRLL